MKGGAIYPSSPKTNKTWNFRSYFFLSPKRISAPWGYIATSDRFRGKRGKGVSSGSNFALVQRRKQKSCQKSKQLRTGSEEKEEKLSEAEATSNSFRGKRRKAVRSHSNFAQVERIKQKSCQKS